MIASLRLAVCVFTCAALLAGCSKDETKGGGGKADPVKPQAGTPTPGSAAPSPATPLTPAQWADGVLSCYKSALKDGAAALSGNPPAEQALPKVKAVYDKYLDQFVALGKQREAMSAEDRKKAENAYGMKEMSLASAEEFKAFIALANGPYSPSKANSDPEKELARLVRGINVITQYANFDVLRKQEPEEARRLGIQ